MRKSAGALLCGLLFLAVLLRPAPSRAAGGLPFGNGLGKTVEAAYLTSPGNPLEKVAGPLDSGKEVTPPVDAMRGNRLVVAMADGWEEDSRPVRGLQFFPVTFLSNVDGMDLLFAAPDRKTRAFPVLRLRTGGQRYDVAAGLPFHLLNGIMEKGMDGAKYAAWLNPANLPGLEPGRVLPFAVVLGERSWSIRFEAAEATLRADLDGAALPLLLDDMKSVGAQPLFIRTPGSGAGGGAAEAFSAGGLRALGGVPGARRIKGLEEAGPDEVYAVLAKRAARAGAVSVRLESDSLDYVLELDSHKAAELRITRR